MAGKSKIDISEILKDPDLMEQIRRADASARGQAMNLEEFMRTDLSAPYKKALAEKDPAVGSMLLRSFGIPETPENLNDLYHIAGATSNEQERTRNIADQVREMMSLDPKQLALRGAVTAGTELLNGGADIIENNANRLAQALLARNRTNSARQNDLYGPSSKEKNAEAYGIEGMRRGSNNARMLRGVANVADKVFGMYDNADRAARTIGASVLTGKGPTGQTWESTWKNR